MTSREWPDKLNEEFFGGLMNIEKHQEAIHSIFRDAGFLYYKSGKYFFSGNRKTASPASFMKELGFPESLEGKGLADLELAFIKKKFPHHLMEKWVASWSKDNIPATAQPSYLTANSEEEAEELVSDDMNEYLKSLVPVINMAKDAEDPIILLDPARHNQPVLDFKTEVYLTLTGHQYDGLVADDNVPKVMTTFDPYNLKSLYIKEIEAGLKVLHVNYYVAPRWRYVEVEPKYGGFIKTLIDHLFPNEDEREWVLDWLHYAVAYRNDTVLCLVGARGTGKAILLGDILGGLVGEKYTEIVNQEILSEKFNGAFLNKRFLFFDEIVIPGDRELNKFKAFCNARIAFEAKNINSYTIDNHTSLAVSSNKRDEFKVEPQERRFSIPEVTEIDFSKVMPREEINSFVKRIKEPGSEELAEFGKFLLARTPKHSSHDPIKGRYYFNLCRLSMAEWKTFLIDYLCTKAKIGEPIPHADLVKAFKDTYGKLVKFPVRRATIEEFLLQYKHEGEYRMGQIVEAINVNKGRSTFSILPNVEFVEKYGTKSRGEDALEEKQFEETDYIAKYGMTKEEFEKMEEIKSKGRDKRRRL